MKYKATKKFKELTIIPHHQNLERKDFWALMNGKIVECDPPKWLIDGGYLERVTAKKKEAK